MDENLYRSARENGFVLAHPRRSLLRMRGTDSLDFLNRMSTNETVNLSVGQAVETVLTDEKARILDDLVVVALEDGVLLLSSRPDVGFTMDWLNRYIIMDDVTLKPELELNLILSCPGEGRDGGNGHPTDYGVGAHVFPTRFGNYLALPGNPLDALEGQAARRGSVRIDETMFEVLRVEKGAPDWPAELSDRFNPLEAGLERAVSFTKGCYIGQEVIARLDSRDKVKRRLTGFRFESPVISGADIFWQDRKIGEATSSVVSPEYGPIALGYVRAGTRNGTPIRAVSGDLDIGGWVARLPFQQDS